MIKKFGTAFIYGAGFVAGGLVVLVIAVKLFGASSGVTSTSPHIAFEADTRKQISQSKFESFEGLALDEKIKKSNAIIITTTRIEATGRKSKIAEILKLDNQANFGYKIGDDYPELGAPVEKGVVYGEKDIVLLAGFPASMRESWAVYSDSIPGLKHMSLVEFRDLVKKLESSPNPAVKQDAPQAARPLP